MRTIRLKSDPAAPIQGLGLEEAELATPQEMEVIEDIESDAQETAVEVDRAAMEAVSLLKRITALEDIAQVVEEQVEKARPSDVVLVDIATDLATDGTDIQGDDVTPGLESALGSTISSEGIKETAAKFFAAVKDRMSRMIEGFRKMFGSVAHIVKARKRQLKELSDKVEAAEFGDAGDVKLGKRIRCLAFDAKTPKKASEINAVLKMTSKDLDVTEKHIIELGHNFCTKIISGFNTVKSPDGLTSEIAEIVREFAPKYTSAPSHGKVRTRDAVEVEVIFDAGWCRIVNGWGQVAKVIKAGADDRTIVEKAYEFGCLESYPTDEFVRTFGKIVKEGGETGIPAGTKAELNAILKTSLEVIEKVERLIPKYDRAMRDSDHVYDEFTKFNWSTTTRVNRDIGVLCLINSGNAVYRGTRSSFDTVDVAMAYVSKSLAAHKKAD